MRALATTGLLALACSSPEPRAIPDSPRESSTATETDTEAPAEVAPTATSKKKKKAKYPYYVSDAERIRALGSLVGLDPTLRTAFAPTDFEPLPKPVPGDWLDEHPERGQSFPSFVAGRHITPDASRDTLYILPLGALKSSGAPPGSELVTFAETYFGIKTKLLPALDAKKLNLRWRKRSQGRQLHAGSVISMLKKRLPDDAFLMIAVTGHDLYPDDDWNFVFGIATFRDRVGVYSTARYNPKFYGTEVSMPGFETIVMRRTLNIMAHEIGHMYGLEHCVHYRCAMNGSNSLAETDRSPIHMCPVCLRKLRHGAKLDVVPRYQALEKFYRSRKLITEADWVKNHLTRFEPD